MPSVASTTSSAYSIANASTVETNKEPQNVPMIGTRTADALRESPVQSRLAAALIAEGEMPEVVLKDVLPESLAHVAGRIASEHDLPTTTAESDVIVPIEDTTEGSANEVAQSWNESGESVGDSGSYSMDSSDGSTVNNTITPSGAAVGMTGSGQPVVPNGITAAQNTNNICDDPDGRQWNADEKQFTGWTDALDSTTGLDESDDSSKTIADEWISTDRLDSDISVSVADTDEVSTVGDLDRDVVYLSELPIDPSKFSGTRTERVVEAVIDQLNTATARTGSVPASAFAGGESDSTSEADESSDASEQLRRLLRQKVTEAAEFLDESVRAALPASFGHVSQSAIDRLVEVVEPEQMAKALSMAYNIQDGQQKLALETVQTALDADEITKEVDDVIASVLPDDDEVDASSARDFCADRVRSTSFEDDPKAAVEPIASMMPVDDQDIAEAVVGLLAIVLEDAAIERDPVFVELVDELSTDKGTHYESSSSLLTTASKLVTDDGRFAEDRVVRVAEGETGDFDSVATPTELNSMDFDAMEFTNYFVMPNIDRAVAFGNVDASIEAKPRSASVGDLFDSVTTAERDAVKC